MSTTTAAFLLAAACAGRDPTWDGNGVVGEFSTTYQGGIEVWTGAEVLAGAPPRSLVLDPATCGYDVLAPGDQSGDGVPDVVVVCGAWDEVLYVYSGADLLRGVATYVGGVAVPLQQASPVALGDVDGDGSGEIGIEDGENREGTPPALWSWGRVVPGAALAGQSQELAWRVVAAGGWFPSFPASSAGDVDGDGVPDVAVAAGSNGTRFVNAEPDAHLYVVSGAALARLPWGAALDATAESLVDLPASGDDGPPMQVVGAGDLDGDARGDLAVAMYPWGTDTAQAAPLVQLVLSGAPVSALDDAPRLVASPARRSGFTELAPLGDLDGDGRGELAIRMDVRRTSEDAWSAVAVVPGAAMPTTGTLSVTPFLLVEEDVAELEPCDLDGDGLPELVTGTGGVWAGTDLLTPGAGPIAESVGHPPEYGESGTEYQGGIDVWTGAEVLAGAPGRPVVLDATDCGHEVLGPGDQDGDGVPGVPTLRRDRQWRTANVDPSVPGAWQAAHPTTPAGAYATNNTQNLRTFDVSTAATSALYVQAAASSVLTTGSTTKEAFLRLWALGQRYPDLHALSCCPKVDDAYFASSEPDAADEGLAWDPPC